VTSENRSTGLLNRRAKTLAFVVDVGRDPGAGRRRQQTRGGFSTKRAAKNVPSEMIGPIADGSYVALDPQRLGEWIQTERRSRARAVAHPLLPMPPR
jgi:hypothetical protein